MMSNKQNIMYTEMQKQYFSLVEKLINGENGSFASKEFWDKEKNMLNHFCSTFPCTYAIDLAMALDKEIKSKYIKGLAQRDVLALKLKYINGDENGEYKSETYWASVVDDADRICKKYKSIQGIETLCLQVLDELEKRSKREKEEYVFNT